MIHTTVIFVGYKSQTELQYIVKCALLRKIDRYNSKSQEKMLSNFRETFFPTTRKL